jgi:hypothetical protein
MRHPSNRVSKTLNQTAAWKTSSHLDIQGTPPIGLAKDAPPQQPARQENKVDDAGGEDREGQRPLVRRRDILAAELGHEDREVLGQDALAQPERREGQRRRGAGEDDRYVAVPQCRTVSPSRLERCSDCYPRSTYMRIVASAEAHITASVAKA